MKRLILTFAILFACASHAWATAPAPLTSLRAIHALSSDEVGKNLPVAFEATVTSFDVHTSFAFMQDDGVGIFVVRIPADAKLYPGDRVLVRGKIAPGFRPFVICDTITVLRHGSLPIPIPVHFDELIHMQRDCLRVTVRAVVQIVDQPQNPKDAAYVLLATGNGFIDAFVYTGGINLQNQLMGAEVEVSGTAAARLDDKWRLNGIQLFVSSLGDIRVLQRAAVARNDAAGALTTLRAIHALSNTEIKNNLPVSFEATVTYLDANVSLLIVQDRGIGIYVRVRPDTKLNMGDRVLVRGKISNGFRPVVNSDTVTLLHHGSLPEPVQADFDELIQTQHDCLRIRTHAVIQAADLAWGANRPIFLQLRTNKGLIDAYLDNNDSRARNELLDAEADVIGIATTKLDGKGQETGILLFVSSLSDIKILQRAKTSPRSLPITSMNEVATAFQVNDLTHRVHVRGTITYFQPGLGAVLQSGAESLWVQTKSIIPLRVGDLADATGFSSLHDGFLVLVRGEIQDSRLQSPVTPNPFTWEQLASSRYSFDLVSIEGQVVTEIRESSQDEYVLVAGGNLFTAIYRHPGEAGQNPLSPMKIIPPGARVRVTGICMLKDSNPYNGPVPFDILLRSFDDVDVVAKPPWLNTRHLIIVVGFLMLVVALVVGWGWTLEHKLRRQTAVMSARTEAEAALERRRSRIFEDISGSRPLAEIIEEITELVSFQLHAAPCWCDVTDGARLGKCPPQLATLRIVQEKIPARSGSPLGVISAAFDSQTKPSANESEALSMAAGLAALAIETRRLYSDLLHRSEFDQLTDIHNRFSLEKLLDAQIDEARLNATVFGLIYIDLDYFKQVNDSYGHQVGDQYLQQATLRLKRQLRPHDKLARLGGDEFAALVPAVRSRAEVEEIAQRLEHSFDEPFVLEGLTLTGSASVGIALYPQDGATRDDLLNAADAAMYIVKNAKRPTKKALSQISPNS